MMLAVRPRLCWAASNPSTSDLMLSPMDQYAALSDALATARPDETWTWAVDNCRCVAVNDCKADMAELLVSMLVIIAEMLPSWKTSG